MRKICLVCTLALALAGAECSPYLRLAVIGAKSTLNQADYDGVKIADISCENDVLTYKYIFEESQDINWEAISGENKKDFLSAMKEILVEEFCLNEDTLALLQRAKSIIMDYSLPSGSLFGRIKLTAKDCEK
ncbi:polyphosphate kinase [Campylobacter showae]|jgi:putative polyphosphate kinase 2|uniref:polyphosphate kinase n=1 Tax=Campylobacter showae TaxID=204 RepID=UPI0028D7DF60|nr:polyphosphate kinase [Campylobacter showae]